MSFLRKTLSMLLGSSEETLVNASSEVIHALGSQRVSNQIERSYIWDRVKEDVIKSKYYRVYPLQDVVTMILSFYLEHWDTKQLQMLNRVLAYYYNYDLKTIHSLQEAVYRLGNDLVVHRNLEL